MENGKVVLGEKLMFCTDAELEEFLMGKKVRVYCNDTEKYSGIVSKFIMAAKYNDPKRTICGIIVDKEEFPFTGKLKIELL